MATNSRDEMEAREERTAINHAIAGTEQEIMDEVWGNDEDDNDGDRELEEMGEGLEGEHLDEEEEGEEPAEEEEGEEEAVEAEGEEGEAVEEPQQGEPQQREPDRGQRVPRSRLNQETERRRAAEAREQEVLTRLAAIEQRMTTAQQQYQQPPQPQYQPPPQPIPPKPDKFAQPDEYDEWMLAEGARRAKADFRGEMMQYHQWQLSEQARRADVLLGQAAQGPDGWKVQAAYRALEAKLAPLHPQDPQRFVAGQILHASDPVGELLDWWDANGGQEYRQQIAEQMAEEFGLQQVPQRRQSSQPRHETRLPQSLRRSPPSLNAASGHGRQQIIDPEMLDDSEESIARFAFRP